MYTTTPFFLPKIHQKLTDDSTLDGASVLEFWGLSLPIACFLALGSWTSTEKGMESINSDAMKQCPLGLWPSIPTTCIQL
jgi:hypothetical protein